MEPLDLPSLRTTLQLFPDSHPTVSSNGVGENGALFLEVEFGTNWRTTLALVGEPSQLVQMLDDLLSAARQAAAQ